MVRKTRKFFTRCTYAPGREQIAHMLFALGLTTRALEFALGVPTYTVDSWLVGISVPARRYSKTLWRIYNLSRVQKSLPGFLRVVVIPASALYSKQR